MGTIPGELSFIVAPKYVSIDCFGHPQAQPRFNLSLLLSTPSAAQKLEIRTARLPWASLGGGPSGVLGITGAIHGDHARSLTNINFLKASQPGQALPANQSCQEFNDHQIRKASQPASPAIDQVIIGFRKVSQPVTHPVMPGIQ